MTDKEHADAAWGYLQQTTISYPEWMRRVGQGSYPDVTKTNWWKAKHELEQIGVEVPPVPSPTDWPEPPVPPVNVIRNAPGLGINVTTKKDIADADIDTTGDTGVLFQKDAGGSTMNRVWMSNVAATNAVSYGKHGVYGKAPDLILANLKVDCSRFCASGISMRYDGAVVRRSEIQGAPHALTYYETSTHAGEVLYEDIRGRFTADTAVWMDAEVDYTQYVIQHFTFRRVAMTGPGAFLKVAAVRWRGSVTIIDSTLNGKPVTAADVRGVPADKLVIR